MIVIIIIMSLYIAEITETKIGELWYLFILISRGVTIRYPHDTIRIAILESRYDTYRDTW